MNNKNNDDDLTPNEEIMESALIVFSCICICILILIGSLIIGRV